MVFLFTRNSNKLTKRLSNLNKEIIIWNKINMDYNKMRKHQRNPKEPLVFPHQLNSNTRIRKSLLSQFKIYITPMVNKILLSKLERPMECLKPLEHIPNLISYLVRQIINSKHHTRMQKREKSNRFRGIK